jgi:hypothetical protein
MGVRVRRSGFGPGGEWEWLLPAPIDAQIGIDAQHNTVSTYGEIERLCTDSQAKDDGEWGEV